MMHTVAMDSIQDFSRRIKARLVTVRELLTCSAADFEQSRHRFAQQLREFDALAQRVMNGIVRPRMERLVTHFPGASLSQAADFYHCNCWFGAAEHSPAMAVLQIGIDHDERLERFELLYQLKVVPAFFPYERLDKLVFDLVPGRVDVGWRMAGSGEERIDEQAVVVWVEDRLLGFVETFSRLQACGTLNHGDAAMDPVCGTLIKKADAKGVREYQGRLYYFCSDQCGQLFAAAPERFAPATEHVRPT